MIDTNIDIKKEFDDALDEFCIAVKECPMTAQLAFGKLRNSHVLHKAVEIFALDHSVFSDIVMFQPAQNLKYDIGIVQREAEHQFLKKLHVKNEAHDYIKKIKKCTSAVRKLEERFVASQQQIDAKAEESQGAILGKIAFAPHRREEMPLELDNEIEAEFYNNLRSYFANNVTIDSENANLLKQLVIRNMYPKIFKKPGDGVIVARGMSVTDAWLMSALKTHNILDEGDVTASFTFTPRHNTMISSWTLSFGVARSYSTSAKTLDMSKYAVMMYARTRDNDGSFVMGPGGLYDVIGFDAYTGEREVIGLGDIKVHRIVWNAM